MQRVRPSSSSRHSGLRRAAAQPECVHRASFVLLSNGNGKLTTSRRLRSILRTPLSWSSSGLGFTTARQTENMSFREFSPPLRRSRMSLYSTASTPKRCLGSGAASWPLTLCGCWICRTCMRCGSRGRLPLRAARAWPRLFSCAPRRRRRRLSVASWQASTEAISHSCVPPLSSSCSRITIKFPTGSLPSHPSSSILKRQIRRRHLMTGVALRRLGRFGIRRMWIRWCGSPMKCGRWSVRSSGQRRRCRCSAPIPTTECSASTIRGQGSMSAATPRRYRT
mmetsp:Transcript_27062/g.88805  ORF Transcript_27062/g.88805 Transcript_27062/m.88805 type:complete len:280 (+) Transcript_27062:122-961(+)